jgi:hypothetical protein
MAKKRHKAQRNAVPAVAAEEGSSPVSVPASIRFRLVGGQVVLLAIGMVATFSGRTSQLLVDTLLAISAALILGMTATFDIVRCLKPVPRAGALIGTSLILSVAWWVGARQIFSLSPPSSQMTAQLAEQNRLQAAQLQPLFRFASKRCMIGTESMDCLELWNDGAPLKSYGIMQASFIEATRLEPASTSVRYIPAYYFIRRDYNDDAKRGLLVTFYAWRDPRGNHQGTNLTREYDRLDSEVRERYGTELFLKKRIFLQISYEDRTQEHHLGNL